MLAMGRWKKDAKEFEVGVNYNDVRGAQSSIPKPVVDALGHPDKVKFVIKDKHVEIEPSRKHD